MPRFRLVLIVALVAVLTPACGVSARSIPTIIPVSAQKTAIYAADGTLITTLQGDENREPVTLDQIPLVLQNAVISIEDERFWEHDGVDLRGIARAARTNSGSGGVSQGGSTITQQYVKTALLTPQRTIQRKIEEASLAIQLEKTYSKQFILEQYLNTIFFGNRSYGVQVASKNYFGHPVQQITLPEAALLAGFIHAPGAYDPYHRPKPATDRRNVVLDQMLKLGYVTRAQHDEAVATPVQVVNSAGQPGAGTYPAAHFVDAVKRFIRTDPHFGSSEAERNDLLVNGGLKIYTTVDLGLQAKAEAAARTVYPNQNRSITDPRKDPDVGLVSIDPVTGYVRAMVGGYDFFDTNAGIHPYAQLNLAIGSGRQVGSTFKPITLATALSVGIPVTARYPAPSATVVRFPGYKPWPVSTGENLGVANLTDCMVVSSNTCYGNLIADPKIGPARVTDMATRLGMNTGPGSGFQTVLSETLGTNNTTVLDMASVYATFDNHGVRVPPTLVTKVVRSDGTVVYQHQQTESKVLEPAVADTITGVLEQVVARGTGTPAQIGRPQAGKTGTTTDNADAWFIGYTPDLVTAVWTGYAQKRPPDSSHPNGSLRTLPGPGARMAAPVWAEYMRNVTAGTPPLDFTTVTGPGASSTTTTTLPPSNTDIFVKPGAASLTNMPAVTPGTTTDAASKIRRAGLKLRRYDITIAGALPGQVLDQSPAPGSAVPRGAEVIIEATPGSPPPTTPIPDVTGQVGTDAAAALTNQGYSVTVTPAPAPAGLLLPNGQPPASGQVWQIAPAVGSVSIDGKLTLTVQP